VVTRQAVSRRSCVGEIRASTGMWSRAVASVMRPGELPTALRGLAVSQVGILVPDLTAAVRSYQATLNLDDWLIYTYTPDNVPEMTYRGDPGHYAMRLAMAGTRPQIELIEPLVGPSVYQEWIDQRGYGVQHLGIHVPHIAAVAGSLTNEGWLPAQTGRGYGVDGDGAFAYYDTVASLGLMLELIELPARRRPSEVLA